MEESSDVNMEAAAEEQNVNRRPSLYMGTCSIADMNLKSLSLDEDEDRGENTSGWGILPDLILEKVLSYLDIPCKYSASMVCRQWNRGFYMQGTWETFQLEDRTLTRHKFNYYMGWQLILDHLRTQMCIFRIGRFIRNIIFSPMSNLFNLYEFMSMLSHYAERCKADEESRLPLHIYTMRFIFRCDLATSQEQSVYGTGGKLLEGVQRLMTNLRELRSLELIDLLLDSKDEAIHLLDDVCTSLCGTLERLVLINTTRAHLTLLHPACFNNLRILKISPQNIGNELVEELCKSNSLEEIHLIQNKYTEAGIPVDRHAWANARFRVFLRTVGELDKEIIWQERAPVSSVIYECPTTKVNWTATLTVIDLYSNVLQEYGHFGLPKFGRSRKFEERPDSMLVKICRKCPYLTTLYIRERISTSTALLIVNISSNLHNFFIRKNALILKCDFRFHDMELDRDIAQWLTNNSKSYESTTMEIAKLLGQYDWIPLTDAKFKEISNIKKAY